MQDQKPPIFIDEDGQVQLPVRMEQETVWLTQKQMALLFDRDYKTVSKHIRNVFEEAELNENSTVAKFATVQYEGEREVTRQVEHYNLDVIISVGYRVKSKRGTKFRQWAGTVLRNYLLEGYALNQKRLAQRDEQLRSLKEVIGTMEKALRTGGALEEEADSLLLLLGRYTHKMVLLNQYDENRLTDRTGNEARYVLKLEEAQFAINRLKKELLEKGEATELFGRPKDKGLEAVVGAINQTVFGEDAYPSLEDKAANLLYLIIKNHPFSDGNKRTGAFLFAWYLQKNGAQAIDGKALVALALLIAQSDPLDKDRLVLLIKALLEKEPSK